ncbi:MAG: alpha/beta hydrolase, partial [Anaerolineae bacterium]|nr:alpha/beta hydrolase [Anaerolineae bacterium]
LSDFHCMVVDLPGHDRSADVEWRSMAEIASQLAEIIRQRAHGGRAHVVGLSVGGYLTLHLMSSAPETVDHALISGIACLPHIYLTISRVLAPLMVPMLKSRRVSAASFRSLHIPEEYLPAFQQSASQLTPEAFVRGTREASPFHLPPHIEQFERPVLVVAGENEVALVRRSVSEIVAHLPHATGRIAPGVGHAWNIEKPDLFTAMIRAWFTNQTLPDALKPVAKTDAA